MALVATMLVLLMALAVLMLGLVSNSGPGNSGVLSLTNAGISLAAARSNSTTAFNNAESGVEFSLEWFHDLSQPPANNSAFQLTGWGLDNSTVPNHTYVKMPTGSFTVVVYPNSANGSGQIDRYMIESAGYSGAIGASGTSEVVIHAYVQQTSFGKYAYFIDEEQSGNWWVGGLTQFDGPVHSNNDNGSGVASGNQDNILWFDNTTTAQAFLYTGADAYTCCDSGPNWAADNISNSQAPSSATNWYSIANGGQTSVQYNTNYIAMPATNKVQQTASLGPSTTAPSTTGVIVPNNSGTTNGGVYITGSVNSMTLSVSNNVNQVITIKQTDSSNNPVTTVVTLDAVNNQTSLAVTSTTNGSTSTTTTKYSGLTNGVVYCTGSIGTTRGQNPGQGLSGVIADNLVNASGATTHDNALTIAPDPSSSGNQQILLNGSLTYNTPPKDANGSYNVNNSSFVGKAGVCGLLSYNIWVQKYTSSGALNQQVEIDGAAMATGKFDSDAYQDSSVLGNFYGVGSYISGQGGYFGLMNLSGVMLAGYYEHHYFDPRLATNPPPFYPTTGTQYDVISWQVGGPASIMS